MDAQIKVEKIDHGLYPDQFRLTITDLTGRHFSVNIKELEYEGLKRTFNWLMEEQPFPSSVRETLM